MTDETKKDVKEVKEYRVRVTDEMRRNMATVQDATGLNASYVVALGIGLAARLFEESTGTVNVHVGDPSDDKRPPTAIASSDEGLGSITSENNKQVGSAEQSTHITTGGQQSHQPAPKTFSAGNQVIDNPMGGKSAPKGNDRKDWMIYKMPEDLLTMSRRDDLKSDEIRVLKNLNNLIMSGGVPQKVIDMAMQDLRDIAGEF